MAKKSAKRPAGKAASKAAPKRKKGPQKKPLTKEEGYDWIEARVTDEGIEMRYHVYGCKINGSDTLEDAGAVAWTDDQIRVAVREHLRAKKADAIEILRESDEWEEVDF